MQNKKRRARTGCLTCRARRVKCDEQVPECRRCIAANVACAGYEQQRVVVPVKPQDRVRRQGQTTSSLPALLPGPNLQRLRTPILVTEDAAGTPSSGSPIESQSVAQYPTTAIIGNHTPLVAFPSSPHPSQCPSLGARHVLGYHQVLLRTLPILFPPQHLQFWRDELLQEAWGCNYLYLTLVALGNIHRAALMTIADDECGRANGLDMKITAVQLYTQSLQELAKHLEEAKRNPVLLVASLCLMAYFEVSGHTVTARCQEILAKGDKSFSGNIPAFIGRIQAADHYFTTLLPAYMDSDGDERSRNRDLAPLRDCLRSLGQTCYVTLPLKLIHAITEKNLDAFYPETVDPECSSSTVLAALHNLVDLISESHEIKELVWSPIAAYARTTSAQVMNDFEQKLIEWRDNHLGLIPELDTDSALNVLLVYKWSQFAMPPQPYTSTTRNKSLVAAHYNFYRARIKWALILLGDDELRNKPTAEFYFYEALRHAASHEAFLTATDRDEDTYIPCEALKVGLLPVLHITGLCSPQPLWLEWIKDLSDQIIQEGVLKGHTFATNLDCLHRFETHRSGSDYPAMLDQYPEPAERIICQLIPEMDGRHFTSFFAIPVAAYDPRCTGLDSYRVIGDARWRCGYGEGPCTPVFNMYDDDSANLRSFSTDWLYSTQPALDWLLWSQEKEFHMERALHDHISGTRLLLAADNAIANGQV